MNRKLDLQAFAAHSAASGLCCQTLRSPEQHTRSVPATRRLIDRAAVVNPRYGRCETLLLPLCHRQGLTNGRGGKPDQITRRTAGIVRRRLTPDGADSPCTSLASSARPSGAARSAVFLRCGPRRCSGVPAGKVLLPRCRVQVRMARGGYTGSDPGPGSMFRDVVTSRLNQCSPV
jgi:hypothetical protein